MTRIIRRGGMVSKMLLGAVLLMMLVGSTDARRRGGGTVVRPPGKLNLSSLNPQQLEEVARQAANNIVIWGTTNVFQLKEAAQMKKQVTRVRAAGGETEDGKSLRVDAALGKQIIEGAIGAVFIMTNSPALGRVTDVMKRLIGEETRKNRIIMLHSQLSEAHGGQLGAGGPAKDPPGFWEGALTNKELATAHTKFMSDVEALSNSPLAKKVSASAEAYHEAMLKYATSDNFPTSKRR